MVPINMGEDDYGGMGTSELLQHKRSRELEKTLSSLSFRLGKLLIESFRKPWLLILLPFTLPNLAYNYTRERLGHKTYDTGITNDSVGQYKRDCIVLFPTNGVGMGHFSRMYSLARSVRKIRPSTEIVFFTTNPVFHIIYSHSFVCYHIPGRKKFARMDPSTWNSLCEENLTNVFHLHKPSYFVFDGSYPYRGMLNAIKGFSQVDKVWVKRISKSHALTSNIDAISHFDRVVIPGDYGELSPDDLSEWPIDEINLAPPMLSISRTDLYPRGEMRSRLGIPDDAIVALVSLGAGVINEIGELRTFVCDCVTNKSAYVVLADSMLNPSRSTVDNNKVRMVREFPIMAYRNCFDFGIFAGGYNSVHEAHYLKLPSVIIPNRKTGSDDQVSRANLAAKETGGFIVINEEDYDLFDSAIDRICDESVRLEMIDSFSKSPPIIDGSPYIAEFLFS